MDDLEKALKVHPFMHDLRRHEGIAARALELTVLTAARTGEGIGNRWPEIEPDSGGLTVSGEREKGGRGPPASRSGAARSATPPSLTGCASTHRPTPSS